MSARVGVLLCGCGALDGSDVHETAWALAGLDRRGAKVICFAPNIAQSDVINHATGKAERGHRQVIEEARRLAWDAIRDITAVSSDDLDALIIPGGLGVAKTLSTFAEKREACTVREDVAALLRKLHSSKKPIGFCGVASILGAHVFGKSMGLHPRLTSGHNDPGVQAALVALGADFQSVGWEEAAVDETNRLVSTAGGTNGIGPWIVQQGVGNVIEHLLRLTGDVASLMRGHMAPAPGSRV